MTKENRARPADLSKLTEKERAELYNTLVAYTGTFTFDGKTAIHNVDVAWTAGAAPASSYGSARPSVPPGRGSGHWYTIVYQ